MEGGKEGGAQGEVVVVVVEGARRCGGSEYEGEKKENSKRRYLNSRHVTKFEKK